MAATAKSVLEPVIPDRADIDQARAAIEALAKLEPRPAEIAIEDSGHRMHAVHVDGTRILCGEAQKAGVKRVVLVSTSGTVAVSDRDDEFPDEESPFRGCRPPPATPLRR